MLLMAITLLADIVGETGEKWLNVSSSTGLKPT